MNGMWVDLWHKKYSSDNGMRSESQTNIAGASAFILGAALIASQLLAAEPFMDGYSLNEGRAIRFTQALPRMRNALTGKPCGCFNNKELAIPGVLTADSPAYGNFLHLLRNVINNERAMVFVNGESFMVNKNLG